MKNIIAVVPAPAVEKLQKVTLWFSPQYFKTFAMAEYHPGVDWLISVRRDPQLVKGVEFTNIPNFPAEINRMPWLVLHELSHGFHDQVLSFKQPDIVAQYNAVKEAGIYDNVERWYGNDKENTFEKAYAMFTPMEYFAESTEAFFGRNDFYPFNREELRKHDPKMEALVERFWTQLK